MHDRVHRILLSVYAYDVWKCSGWTDPTERLKNPSRSLQTIAAEKGEFFSMVATNRGLRLRMTRWSRLAGRACFVLGAAAYAVQAAEPKPAKDTRDEALAARRFELLRQHVAAAEVQSNEADFPSRFSSKPIFKYSDPARGYVAAAVWKLGEAGRPKALLASELDRRDHGVPCISYEYISLTTTPFSLTSADMGWSPSRTLLKFAPIPRTAAPGNTPQRRLTQIREIARRFASREDVKSEICELRLLPAPIDRYSPSKADRADGAIFFFTFGTNPEVVLFLESDGKQWSYAASRMTGAQTVELTLDGAVVWEGAPLEMGRDSPFTGSITPIAIPGIAADGSEI